MKNILKTPLGFLFAFIFLISCKKDKTLTVVDPPPVTTEIANGLPANPKKINGYLYASCVSSIYSGSGNTYSSQYRFAAFGDPARNLISGYNHYSNITSFNTPTTDMANVSVGDLNFNGVLINSGGSTSYQSSTYTNSPDYTAHWVSEGNLSFKPLDLLVSRGFPVISILFGATSYALNLNNDFKFDLNNVAISNYDSVAIGVSDYTTNGYKIKKMVSGLSNSVTFTQSELRVLSSTNNGNIIFYAFNYSTKIIEDKVYVFELLTRVNVQLIISQ